MCRWNPSYPAERLGFMLKDAELPVLLTREDELQERLPPHAARTVLLDAEAKRWARLPTQAPPSQTTADHLAYVLYTSGSTGRPKGVAIHSESRSA